MMNLENQCVSLELAKKLKELGVEQSSLFYHLIGGIVPKIEALPLMGENHYSAFTSDELFELLPGSINTKHDKYNHFYLAIHKKTTGEYVALYKLDTSLSDEKENSILRFEHLIFSQSPKLADCLAELLILVKEQGLDNE